jgi:hypothetical protein
VSPGGDGVLIGAQADDEVPCPTEDREEPERELGFAM